MRTSYLAKASAGLAAAALPMLAFAADAVGQTEQQPTNWNAIVMFLLFAALTLFITRWAAKNTRTAKDFYAAGGAYVGTGSAIARDAAAA